jgi:Na+/phosphate symporter
MNTYGVCMHTNETFPQVVAANVGTAIRAAGESVKGVAESTGIARVTLIRRLSGVTPFTVAEIAAIANHLHVTPAQLINGKAAA